MFLSHLNSYSGKFSSANYEINESNSSPSTWLGPTHEYHHLSVTRLWALHEYLFYHKDSNRSLCCFGLCCEQPYGAFFLLDSASASASCVSSFYLTPCPKGFGSTLCGTSKTVQWAKASAAKPLLPEFSPQNPHGRRKEFTLYIVIHSSTHLSSPIEIDK